MAAKAAGGSSMSPGKGPSSPRPHEDRVERPVPARADGASVWLCSGRSESQGTGELPMWGVRRVNLKSAVVAVVMGNEPPPVQQLIWAGGRGHVPVA
jgi:hypothetical protein